MTIIAIYLLAGFFACIVDVAISARKKKEPISILVLFDPIMIAAWPIMLVMSAIERAQPPENKIESRDSEPEDYSHKTGTVIVELRPTGKIEIGNIILDARSKFGIVATGRKVPVVGRELGELIVEEKI